MTWPDFEKEVPLDVIGDLVPEEVLFEFEWPLIFTCRSAAGPRWLAYLATELPDGLRYIVVPAGQRLVSDLTSGARTILEALTDSWAFVVDADFDQRPRKAWSVEIHDIPAKALPRPGTMLRPDLEPLLAIRLEGDAIKPGATPASVIALGAEGPAKAVKTLFDHVHQHTPAGRPTASRRALYNLPAQRIAFGSLEIAFRAPERAPGAQATLSFVSRDEEVRHVSDLLRRGLSWLCNGRGANLGDDHDETIAILTALKKLAPPRDSGVDSVVISGAMVTDRERPSHSASFKLNRAEGERVSRTLREFKKNRQRLVRREGEVREFDKDSLMFSLRDVKDAETEGFQCSADRDLYDDIMEAFTEGYRVEVIGVQVGQKIEVAAMSPLVGGEERADAALGVTGPGSPDLQEGSEREDLD